MSRQSALGFVLGFATCALLVLGYSFITSETVPVESDSGSESIQPAPSAPAVVGVETPKAPTTTERIVTLSEALQRQPNNADGWLALYRLYREVGEQTKALDALRNFSHYELNTARVETELTMFKHELQATAEVLLQQSLDTDPADDNNDDNNAAVNALIQQVEALLGMMPVDAELHWLLAQLYRASGDPYQADYHALLASSDPRFQTEEPEPQPAQSQPPIDAPLVIPLRQQGSHFLVNVVIAGNPALLMLDTGASMSGVTRTFADRHAALVRQPRTVLLGTAGGTAQGELFTVTSLELGDLVFRQHDMVVFPTTDNNPFDGVLGLDILGKFDFYIDQNEPALHLRYAQAR